MEAQTFATVVAALATTCSAAVVAWQAVETRKSAHAATRAADASERALDVANESLAIARDQSEQGQFTALEALRARLDELGPSVSVRILPENRPLYVIGDSSSQEAYTYVPLGTLIEVPQQQDQWLYVMYRVRIVNSGTHPVTLHSHPGFFLELGQRGPIRGRNEIHLEPGSQGAWYILVGGQITRWVYGAETDKYGHNISGEGGWATSPDADKGVALSQELKIMGSIIYPAGLGKWELRGIAEDVNYNARLRVKKVERLYFRSEGK
ncbi:hypothetical protein [Arthrobacter sp. zg-Y750]|uniref:hypothetical protein n=1 Tax=Arthrobacter sp. zg-Y750 TaxID=2894189 RepID=UPI001E48235E|nr:hypothetical protein [Arthrobacter sp. zg-Y750]MCC9178540.1 hypothetical protein [Arthrobacter sp. zg-Y750]